MRMIQKFLPLILTLVMLDYFMAKSDSSGAANAGDTQWLTVFVTMFVAILLEAVPFVLLGAVISGAIEVLAPGETLVAWIPRKRQLAILLFGLAGIVLPICECGVVPVLRRLLRKGVPLSCGITYLLAAPIVQPLVAASTFLAFGRSWKIMGLRLLGGYLIAVTVGMLSHNFLDPTSEKHFMLGSNDHDDCHPPHHENHSGESHEVHAHGSTGHFHGSTGHDGCDSHAPHLHDHVHEFEELRDSSPAAGGLGVLAAPSLSTSQSLSHRVERFRRAGNTAMEILEHSAEDFLSTSSYLILGAFLAAAMQTFVGQNVLNRMSQGPILSTLVMMMLAFTLSLCSQADAFVAASFTQFPMASRLGFMVFGPTVDIKLIAMYQGFLSKKASAFIFGSVTVLVLCYSLLLHWLGV